MKKIIAFICTMALVVTGVCFAPRNVKAYYPGMPTTIRVSLSKDTFVYNGRKQAPEIKVYLYNEISGYLQELTEGYEYYATYSNNILPGTAKITINVLSQEEPKTEEVFFKIIPRTLNSFNIYLDEYTFDYTGGRIYPEVFIDDPRHEITLSMRDYRLEYKNNIKCGWGEVVLTGKNGTTGKIVKKFRIKPVAKQLKLRANEKKKLKVKGKGKFKYKSKNKKIAKVDKKGFVTGIKKGKTKIKITCNGQTTYAKVTVKKAKVVRRRKKTSTRVTYTIPKVRRTPSSTPVRTKKKKVIPKS